MHNLQIDILEEFALFARLYGGISASYFSPDGRLANGYMLRGNGMSAVLKTCCVCGASYPGRRDKRDANVCGRKCRNRSNYLQRKQKPNQ